MAQKVASIMAEIGIDSSKFSSGASSLGGAVSGIINSLAGMNSYLTIAGGALAALAAYMGEAEKAAVASNIETAKQEAILKATGYAAGLASSELQALTNSLSKLTGVDDEAITSAESLMLTFRNIGRNEFPQAMQAALDLSTTFGSLESSSMQLGKALNDPIKGVTALGRAGVTFSDTQKEQIANFVKTNELAKAQAIILDEVNKQVGGTAAAIERAGDASGRLDVAYGNLSEAIGQRLIPAQRAWNTFLADTYDTITDNVTAAGLYSDTLETVRVEQGLTTDQLRMARAASEEYNAQIENSINETIRATEYGQAWEVALRAQGVQFVGNTSLISEFGTSIQGLEKDYQGLLDVTVSLAGASDEATAKIAYNNTIQKLSVDGLTQAEFEMANAVGVSLGIFDEKTAASALVMQQLTDAVITGRLRAEDLGAAIKNLPSGKTIDVILSMIAHYTSVEANDPQNLPGGYGYANAPKPKALGGPSGGRTLVGENGPEVLDLPAGSYIHNNNATKNMTSWAGADNSAAIIDAISSLAGVIQIDYRQLARAVRGEQLQDRR